MLEWLATTPLSLWVLESNYGFYIMLSGHAIGMALVAGIILVLGLRLLGFSKGEPLMAFDRLFTAAGIGFLLNLATGLALFAANAERLLRNPAFLIKIGLILLGGLTIWILWRAVKAEPTLEAAEVAVSSQVRVLAVVTMLVWVAAIIAGRWIAYTPQF
jgi:hypothetical protein